MSHGITMILACMERQNPIRLPGTSLAPISDMPAGRDYEIVGVGGHLPHEEVVATDSLTAAALSFDAPNLLLWNGQRHVPIITLKAPNA